MKRKMLKILKSEKDYIKNIIDDMNVNEEKYSTNYYNRHYFNEQKRKNDITGFHDIFVIAYEHMIVGSVCFYYVKRYDYKISIVYDRKNKKYEDVIEFCRLWKNKGHGYYEKLNWDGKKIIGEYD